MPTTKLKCKCYTQDDFYICLWCQWPNWRTNTIPKETFQPACVVKGQTDVQIPYTSTPLNLPVMPKSILKYICQAKNTSQDQKIREQTWVQIEYPRISLKLPVMPKIKLKYKCDTQEYLSTCLWCPRSIWNANNRTQEYFSACIWC